MTHTQFVSIKKLTGSGIVAVASKHNLRELGLSHGAHIDLRKSARNRILRGPDNAAAVAELARSLMDEAGVTTVRKDAVRALEIVFSLPPSSDIDAHAYFEHAVQWSEQHFGAPIISAVEHADESARHAHVLILPLVDGRMVGSRMMGGPGNLRATLQSFHDEVGERFGLTIKAPKTRHSAAHRRHVADAAICELKSNRERLNDPEVVAALGALIGADPDRLLRALGIEVVAQPARRKARPAKSFVAQMTRVMKPERAKPKASSHQSLGIASNDAPGKTRSLTCVGFQLKPASFQAEDGLLVGAGLPPTHGRRRLSPSSSSQLSQTTGLRAVHSPNTETAGRKQ